MRTYLIRGTALLLATVLVAATGSYLLDPRQAYERVRGKSAVVPSPFGDIEYSQGGSGPPVLVIHGGGGGFDQGELLVEASTSALGACPSNLAGGAGAE
jgi:2-hydroxy-6-oxonona-2,4-dienedioate hydrolase